MSNCLDQTKKCKSAQWGMKWVFLKNHFNPLSSLAVLIKLERFSEALQLNPGAFELLRILKSMGFKTALLNQALFLNDLYQWSTFVFSSMNSSIVQVMLLKKDLMSRHATSTIVRSRSLTYLIGLPIKSGWFSGAVKM